MTPTDTQQLLGFISDQKLDLEQFPSLIPLLEKHFDVFEKKYNLDPPKAHGLLVDRIVRWEKGEQTQSLEATIDELFSIGLILPIPKKTEAKVVQHPDKDILRIRKETTHAAGVIDREMKRLQKMFPEHRFELSFEFQRLGKKKFYKIHHKTFKDE